MSKNLDETVRLQSKKREEWVQEVRGERPQGISEGRNNTPRPANLSAALFHGRNWCLGTHCSLDSKGGEDNFFQRV